MCEYQYHSFLLYILTVFLLIYLLDQKKKRSPLYLDSPRKKMGLSHVTHIATIDKHKNAQFNYLQ